MDSNKNRQGKIEKVRKQTLASSVGSFVNAINNGRLIHRERDGGSLSQCVRVADRRSIRGTSEGFGFGAIDGSTEMAALEAAAMAFAKAEGLARVEYGRIASGKAKAPTVSMEGISGAQRSIL